MITKDTVDKVRKASSISKIIGEYAQIRQKGRDNWCCCPHHVEKTPSCKIDESRQLYHCFGCGEGGDVFHFIQVIENMNFVEAVRYLAEKGGVEIFEDGKRYNKVSQSKQERLKQICKETAKFYQQCVHRDTSPMAEKCRKYMSGRGFNSDLAKRWNLGFAPGKSQLYKHLVNKGFKLDEMIEANVVVQNDRSRINDRFFNRLMFQITDVSGSVIAFGGRVIDDGEPKYLNSNSNAIFNKNETLYAIDRAKNAITSSGYAVVVEGYTDVIALQEHGVKNAVATLGTALGIKHIRLLSRFAKKGIIYVFDGDEAGQQAIERACSFIDSSMTPEAGILKVELLAITLPEGLDPAEYVEKYGQEKTQELFKTARPLLGFGIDRKLSKFDLKSPSSRSKAFLDALKILAPIKDSIL
ncbi:MAG: DNA primase, partial [Eggerthellaceae bacterium]|nr:DNA primase [Eggerthellaceae bacterium]